MEEEEEGGATPDPCANEGGSDPCTPPVSSQHNPLLGAYVKPTSKAPAGSQGGAKVSAAIHNQSFQRLYRGSRG